MFGLLETYICSRSVRSLRFSSFELSVTVAGAESASQIHSPDFVSSSSKQRANGYQSNDLKIVYKDPFHEEMFVNYGYERQQT
jgi:hypothetical protein